MKQSRLVMCAIVALGSASASASASVAAAHASPPPAPALVSPVQPPRPPNVDAPARPPVQALATGGQAVVRHAGSSIPADVQGRMQALESPVRRRELRAPGRAAGNAPVRDSPVASAPSTSEPSRNSRSVLWPTCATCTRGSIEADGPHTQVFRRDYGVQGNRLSPFPAPVKMDKPALKAHIAAHRQRIEILALELWTRFQDRFPNVTREEVIAAARGHDEMKITGNRQILRAYGFGGDRATGRRPRTVASHLVELWGTRASSEDGLDPERARVLKAMNAGDKHFEKGFSEGAVKIVNLADKVDKGLDPLTKFEELGRVAIGPSQYLSNPLNPAHDQAQAEMARSIEQDYYDLIPAELLSHNYIANTVGKRPAAIR